jgi:hypothetical protein
MDTLEIVRNRNNWKRIKEIEDKFKLIRADIKSMNKGGEFVQNTTMKLFCTIDVR